jgi:ABC-type uncharacterized transport system substrate-binding protein
LTFVQAALKRTTQVPILFVSGFDPTHLGFVSSPSRPNQNATGISVCTRVSLICCGMLQAHQPAQIEVLDLVEIQ